MKPYQSKAAINPRLTSCSCVQHNPGRGSLHHATVLLSFRNGAETVAEKCLNAFLENALDERGKGKENS